MKISLLIISLSLFLQMISALVALRLALSGKRTIGAFMLLLTLLMTFRRAISFYREITGDAVKIDLPAELTALIISCILLLGFLYIVSLISAHKREIDERIRTETALEETNAKLHALIQSMPDMVVFKDVEGRHLLVNRVVENLTGRKKEDFLGKTVDVLFPPEAAGQCRRSDEEALKSTTSVHFEEQIPGKGGETRYLDTLKAPIFDDNRNIVGLVTVSRDITARKRQDEEIRESEERFRRAFENAGVGASIVDFSGRFLKVNKRLCEMLGYQEKELLSKTFSDISHPDDIKKGLDALSKLIAGKADYLSFEKRYICRDGRIIHGIVSPSAIRDKNGTPVCCLGMWQDITEQKRASEIIELLSRRNEMILKSAGEGIYGLDQDGNITFINPAAAEMIGWSVAELIGKRSHETFHHTRPDGSPYPREECAFHKALKSGTVHKVKDEVFWRKDGSSFPIEYVSTPMRENNTVVGAVVVFKDVSDHIQAEKTPKAAVISAGEKKAKSEAVIAAIGDNLVILDPEFRIIYQNEVDRKMNGDLVGKCCYKAFEGRETVCDNCPVELSFKDGLVHRGERIATTKVGIMHLDITASPLLDVSGKVIAVIEMVRDITSRKHAEEAIRRSRDELEKQVNERTAELTMMNEQLRNFSSYL